jgi:hypothetical protein
MCVGGGATLRGRDRECWPAQRKVRDEDIRSVRRGGEEHHPRCEWRSHWVDDFIELILASLRS